jgi:MFS family permease
MRMFYGWRIVMVSILGLSVSHGVVAVLGFGVFIPPLTEDFGWSRTQISGGILIGTYTVALLAPLAGYIVDHYGVRRPLAIATVFYGLAIGSMYYFNSSIWVFYLIFAVIGVFGAMTTPVSYSKLMVNWFDRRRGLALGLSLAGVGVGVALVPKLSQAIMSAYSWREAYMGISLIIVFISAPIVYLVVRDKPADMGLRQDGDSGEANGQDGDSLLTGFTVREALRTRHYWMMMVTFFLLGLVLIGATVHLIPMLIDRGVTPSAAASTAGVLGVSLIIGRVFAGYLMDRFHAPYVALCFLLGPVIGLALFAMGASGGIAVLCAVLIGMATGAEFDVIAFFISRYLGLKSFGKIYGQIFGLFQVGCGLGPLVMGISFDRTGSYTFALWILCGMVAFACLLIALMGPYTRFEAAQEGLQPAT